jgi:hypothetical protein
VFGTAGRSTREEKSVSMSLALALNPARTVCNASPATVRTACQPSSPDPSRVCAQYFLIASFGSDLDCFGGGLDLNAVGLPTQST